MSVCSICRGYGFARGSSCWNCKGSGSDPDARTQQSREARNLEPLADDPAVAAMCDSSYRAGALAGWNAANHSDPEEGERVMSGIRSVEPGSLASIAERNRQRSARSLALGGQQGEERPDFADAVDQFISDAIENGSVEVMDGSVAWNRPGVVRTLRESLKDCGYEIVATLEALSTTPARAEAQDEGTADALTLLTELLDGPSQGTFHGINDALRAKLETIRQTLQSPTPAADADRVRIAVEALGLTREMLAAGSDRSLILGHLDQALAALKSTAAKEGGA